MSTHESAHRHRLMYTSIARPGEAASDRWIEASAFGLWQCLMETRHGFVVEAPTPCVWLPRAESNRYQAMLAHQGFCTEVVRLNFEVFDPRTGIADLHTRFVGHAELELVTDRLYQHFSRDSKITLWTSNPGTAVSSQRDATACA
ncbi:MAG: hypothetical protein RIC89_06570 [Pseudomonadales bacterium]